MDEIEVTTVGDAPPPLTVMSLGLRTVVNSRSQQVEIVAASCLVHHEFYVDKPAPPVPFQQHFCSKFNLNLTNLIFLKHTLVLSNKLLI